MLGTGCAVPSKHRAPAAIYLHAFVHGGLLLDAGEGCLGQLCALLGAAAATRALRRLSAVWISHYHADHHLGLTRILDAATALRPPSEPPLLVIGPRAIGLFLKSYSSVLSSNGCHADACPRFRFETCASLCAPRSAGRDWLLRRSGLGLVALQCVPVVHCNDAWGLVLKHSAGWSVVYSGDTRPCDALVAAGRGATLLIHEATFDDDRQSDAQQKRHSTRREAIDVGTRMGAYRTLLTHLSQRYRDLHEAPRADGARRERDESGGCTRNNAMGEADGRGTSAIAFDLMAVNLADLPQMPCQMALLERYFTCEQQRQKEEQEQESAVQRARSERLEREIEEARYAALRVSGDS